LRIFKVEAMDSATRAAGEFTSTRGVPTKLTRAKQLSGTASASNKSRFAAWKDEVR
jgi:hypothetical protein